MNLISLLVMVRRFWGLVAVLLVLAAGVYFFNWRIYRNDKQGYEIKLPRTWVGEMVEGAAEVFWSPDRKAYVAVQLIDDQRLLETGGEEKIIKEIKESFKKDKNYELISFQSRFEEEAEPATTSGYLARGFLNYQDERYVFQEYAVQIANEEILAVIRGAMQQGAVKNYEKMVEEIMESFDPVVGRREALALIEKQPEVLSFEKELAKAGKKAVLGVRGDGDDWLVQVYEIVEQNGETHTATFNWYRVNKETKRVTREF